MTSSRLITSLLFVAFLTVTLPALSAETAKNVNQPNETTWPALPAKDGSAMLPAQSWRFQEGPRQIEAFIHYPGKQLANVNQETGLMLSLHNWGGTKFRGTADPQTLADRYNVVAIGVNYLQSGPYKETDPPYDLGYLQTLDALRALYWVYQGLEQEKIPFDKRRIYCTGGSGGGNLTLTTNKFAPRTFACSIDLSGIAKITDDLAFGLPGGSPIDAGYEQDPQSPRYLSPDEQAIRCPSHLEHLKTMHKLGNTSKVLVIHGVDDQPCQIDGVREMIANMKTAKLDVEPHLIDKQKVDGHLFTNSEHSLGDRTKIVLHLGDKYLLPSSKTMAARPTPCDFECRDEKVQFQTPNGRFIISYTKGYPVGRFEPTKQAGPRSGQSMAMNHPQMTPIDADIFYPCKSAFIRGQKSEPQIGMDFHEWNFGVTDIRRKFFVLYVF